MNEEQTIICRCEEVTLKDLIQTMANFKCSPRELKLRTRAGMGYCGGRTCRVMIDSLCSQYNKGSLPNEIPLKYQPPVRPVPFGHLGGHLDK